MESNCCGAEIYENTDICMACKEHCEPAEGTEDTPIDAWLKAMPYEARITYQSREQAVNAFNKYKQGEAK